MAKQGLAAPGTLQEVPPFAGYAEDCDFDADYDSECAYSDTQSAWEETHGAAETDPTTDDSGDSSSPEYDTSDAESQFAGEGWHE